MFAAVCMCSILSKPVSTKAYAVDAGYRYECVTDTSPLDARQV